MKMDLRSEVRDTGSQWSNTYGSDIIRAWSRAVEVGMGEGHMRKTSLR